MAKIKVFLMQDVKNVGKAGEIVDVADGFAANFITPRKLGVVVTAENATEFKKRLEKLEKQESVEQAKAAALAEKIKTLTVTIKTKMDAEGKLYGAIRSQIIVDELARRGVAIGKNMVVFDKPIKGKGTYMVSIQLSAQLKPQFALSVIPE